MALEMPSSVPGGLKLCMHYLYLGSDQMRVRCDLMDVSRAL